MQHAITIRSDDMNLSSEDKMRLLLLFILLGALSSRAKRHFARKGNKKMRTHQNLDSRLRKDLREMKEEIQQLGTDHTSMMQSMDYFRDVLRQGWERNQTEYDRRRRSGKGVSGEEKENNY